MLELSLAVGEANLSCEALKIYRFEDDSEQARTIWQRVDAAIQQDYLNQKWSVNRDAFIRKQGLNHLQAVALVDALERYGVREQANSAEPLGTKLLRVDLLKCCDFAL